jgi:PAS domain S-box-containing protein
MSSNAMRPEDADRQAAAGDPVSALSSLEPRDLRGLLHACEALSAELVTSRVIDTLMNLAINISRAARGVLLLEADSEARFEVAAIALADGTRVDTQRPDSANPELPESVIEWVLTSRDPVSIDDAALPNAFSADPYVARCACRSALCLPLATRAKLVGVLYLEHGIDSRVFSEPRTTLMAALASQAALSLQNARVHAELERASYIQRRMIDSIPTLGWTASPDGVGNFFNRRWLDYTGLTLEEARSGWVVAIHSEDLPNLMRVWQGLMASGQPGGVEARLRGADGAYRWFLFRAHPLHDEKGNVMEWFGSNTDIEERKQAEFEFAARARFSTLRSEVSAGLAGASMHALDAQIELALRRIGEFFDLDSVSIHGLRTLGDEAAPNHAWTRDAVARTVLGTAGRLPQLVEALRCGNDIRLTRVKDMPQEQRSAQEALQALGVRSMCTLPLVISGVSSASMHLISVSREFDWPTETIQGLHLLAELFGNALARQRAELELSRSAAALEHAQRELANVTRMTTLGELAAAIAHQINQPLAAMVADASACLNWLSSVEPDLPSVRNALEAVTRDGERAGQVLKRVRSLLSRSFTDVGACDLCAVIESTVPLVRGQLERDGVTLETRLAPESASVLGDALQLQQVVLNLVLNASEASRHVASARRQVVIRTSFECSDGVPSVIVSVEDTGSGIAAEELAHVFETFYTTKASGFGMGLSISRTIIERHGGRLWAESSADVGSTFHFALARLA